MSKIFNDPIYGYIEIPSYCIQIIDTPFFQRLRYLKQLGCTYFVFHGANHTRFEHSIGVCYLAGEWIKHLKKIQPELQITDEDIKIVQISGLLHDIGHGPLSHTFETFINMTRPGIDYRHENMSIQIVKAIFSSYEGDVSYIESIVSNIIVGLPIAKSFLGQIINNTINGIDADKLDYFTRDSQCTSFKIGCDWKRIIYESRVIDNEIVFPKKLVGDIWNLYQTRFRLYKDLYFHKTVRIIERHLVEALIIADKHNVFSFKGLKLSESINDINSFLYTQDDIIGQMERCNIPCVLELLNKIITRKFDVLVLEKRYIHYGTHKENPLLKVKFFDKNLQIRSLNYDTIAIMCPAKFYEYE